MWDIPPTGPIIAPGALHPFHAATRAGAAHVVPIDDLYHLVYWGTDPDGQHHILHATSAPDAPNDWTPTNDPLLSAQPENPYNSRGPSFPFLLPVSADYWLLYYCGWGDPRPDGAQTGHGDTIPQIGIAYAESDDGLHWAKPRADWIVKPRGFAVEPYEYICSKPFILQEPRGYRMWVHTFGTAYRVRSLRHFYI